MTEKEKRTEKETYEKPELKKDGNLNDVTAGGSIPVSAEYVE